MVWKTSFVKAFVLLILGLRLTHSEQIIEPGASTIETSSKHEPSKIFGEQHEHHNKTGISMIERAFQVAFRDCHVPDLTESILLKKNIRELRKQCLLDQLRKMMRTKLEEDSSKKHKIEKRTVMSNIANKAESKTIKNDSNNFMLKETTMLLQMISHYIQPLSDVLRKNAQNKKPQNAAKTR